MKDSESKLQEKCRTFVGQHVFACVSSLIGDLARNYDAARALDIDEDELRDLCVQDDFKEPVEDYLRQEWDRTKLVEALTDAGFECYDHEDKEALLTAYLEHLETEGELESFANGNDIQPHTNEAYEHWIVSDQLARELEERGEIVARDFMGMTIWGRCTTGQAILLDWVIRDIVEKWGQPIVDRHDAIRALKDLCKAAGAVDSAAAADIYTDAPECAEQVAALRTALGELATAQTRAATLLGSDE